MRLLSSAVALFLTLVIAGASVPNGKLEIAGRHNRATATKKCASRKNKEGNASPLHLFSSCSTTSAASPSPTSAKAVSPAKKPATSAPAPVVPVTTNGLIKVASPNCGPSGATKAVTTLSGPNGNIDWLNCGFESGGWQPPNVRMQDIITQSLSSAVQSPSSPFKACSKYITLFETYGAQYGISPIILASFAMQESSCNPNTVGGAGEQGLMQITRDKCGGAPGGNCKDPDFNIHTAAKFFKATLDDNNGNVILSVGTYNGWSKGLTKAKAFAAAHTSCCRCQNNGDYLHQFFNGWCQNINAYDHKLGKYFNLDICG
ncbi:glycoside hydrolase family 23 protein [Pholiota molesta]|nr:glycoside hydrolase family 23 protein [Pholiota molesta]